MTCAVSKPWDDFEGLVLAWSQKHFKLEALGWLRRPFREEENPHVAENGSFNAGPRGNCGGG